MKKISEEKQLKKSEGTKSAEELGKIKQGRGFMLRPGEVSVSRHFFRRKLDVPRKVKIIDLKNPSITKARKRIPRVK